MVFAYLQQQALMSTATIEQVCTSFYAVKTLHPKALFSILMTVPLYAEQPMHGT